MRGFNSAFILRDVSVRPFRNYLPIRGLESVPPLLVCFAVPFSLVEPRIKPMKARIQQLVATALEQLADQGILPRDTLREPVIENARDPAHGDFATNAAMVHAKGAGMKPRELAERLVEALPSDASIEGISIAGPGFINFRLADRAWQQVVAEVLDAGDGYGRSAHGAGERVQVEFVSANPTGPLHVGHGRGAAYGAVVADLLKAVGYSVHSEYYVNDAGRQMNILAVSVWLRYLELCDEKLRFPSNAYKGDYVWDIAARLHREHGEAFHHPADEVFAGIPVDLDEAHPDGDKEAHIDGLIERTRELLGEEGYRIVFDIGLNLILDDIREDLELFGVHYDEWYSERRLVESGAVERAIAKLREAGHVYADDKGTQWFRSSAFGDEKDRVVVRGNGQPTYFASDIAYHMEKFERGFSRVIDVWGADHHGYVPRVKAAIEALGEDPQRLEVLLVQFAVLYRGGEKVQMSTRSGQFVTLRQLRKDVGKDAARFFYVMRKCEQHLDFDLDLATSKSNENPVYYVQYAHARVCSVLRQADEKGLAIDIGGRPDHLERLEEPRELALLRDLARYPEVVLNAALHREPHLIPHYLRDLANDFHTYYNACQILVEDEDLRAARLALILAVRQVLRNGLALIGVSAPDRM